MRTLSSFLLCPLLLLHLSSLAVVAQLEIPRGAMAVECINLTEQSLPDVFYRDLNGEFAPFPIQQSSRGRPVLVPQSSTFTLFREAPDPEDSEATIMVPVFEITIDVRGNEFLIVFFRDAVNAIQTTVIPSNTEIHPGGSIRVFNLTEQQILCLVGEERVNLSAGSIELRQLFRANSDRFSFAFGLLEPRPYRSPVRTLPMRHDRQRVAAIFSYHERIVDLGDGNPNRVLVPDVSLLYDSVN